MSQRERDIIEAAHKLREIVLATGHDSSAALHGRDELVIAAMIPDDGPSVAERRAVIGPKIGRFDWVVRDAT